MASAVVGLSLLGLVELGLRVVGYGYPVDFFLKRRVAGDQVLTENSKFGYRFFPPAVARAPVPFSIPDPKPPGTYRIFVLGESAAMGDPEPGFGFSRMLGVMLEARYPATRFEVVNIAMTAINSHAILPIAQNCAENHGDLWVIYMGNNEVHGPFGAGVAFGWQSPPRPVVRTVLALNALRLGQAVKALASSLQPASPARTSWQGLRMFLDHQVAANDPHLERVYSSFESNLQAILRAGSHAGVAQVLCTVGVNLKDMPPLASRHGPAFKLARADAWQGHFTNGIAAEAAGYFSAAVEFYRQAAQLDPDYAELQFRRGRCFEALGRYAEARNCFEQARDLDTLRFRTDSRLNEIIQRCGKGRTNDSIHFLDIDRLLAVNSAHGLTGNQWFGDHVHFAISGNFLVASALAEQIARILPKAISAGAVRDQWLSREECLRRLGWNDWSLRLVLLNLQQRMLQPPFNNQLGHAERAAQLAGGLANLAPATQRPGLQQAALELREALAGRPDDPVLHDRLARVLASSQDLAGALEHWQTVARLLPHHPVTYHNLGLLLSRNGKDIEAEKYFTTELQLDPDSVEALDGIGSALVKQNRLPEAIPFFKRALRLRPGSAGVRTALAAALEQQGKVDEALNQYRETVRLLPEAPGPRVSLGNFLLQQGNPTEAVAQLRKAVELAPGAPAPHLALGLALEAQLNLVEAIVEYRQALQLDPANDSVRTNLARALARQPEAR